MIYSGTYNVLPGDVLVFGNNGKTVITEREVKDDIGKKINIFTFAPAISETADHVLLDIYMANTILKTKMIIKISDESCKDIYVYNWKKDLLNRPTARVTIPLTNNRKIFWKCIPGDQDQHISFGVVGYFKSEEKKMNNYFMLDGNRIPMSDKTAESLRKEQTYKIGDCFRVGPSKTLIRLVQCDISTVVAVIIGTYIRWADPQRVTNCYRITRKELGTIIRRTTYVPVTVKVEEIK